MIGRQIRFFFTPLDEEMFLKELKRRGDFLITDKNEDLGASDPSFYNNNSISQIWIKSPKSNVVIGSNGFIERDESEVIEYSRSISELFFKPPPLSKTTFEAYVSRVRSGPPGALLYRDGKFIKPNEISLEELKKEYESLLKKKDTKDKRILDEGRLWAAMNYLNKDQTNFIQKEKWFKDWYDSYVKWIKKYCRISKSMYKDYIGEDAYKAYKASKYQIFGDYKWE